MNTLTTEAGVVALMQSSESETEWKANCHAVKIANGGRYPEFWFLSIIVGGVLTKAQDNWHAATLAQKTCQ